MSNTAEPRSRARDYAAVGGGQAIENYDWLLYGMTTAYFAPHFFPSDDAIASTLSALAVFGVAFAARPIGAALLGPIADRVGRKPMMMASVATMALCSFLIGSLPTHISVGWFAAATLVLLRLVQGISIGVEQPLLSSYVVELAPRGKAGRYAGLMQAASQVGAVLASSVTFVASLVLGDALMGEWGWRIPFWIGGALGLVVLWLRRTLPETLHADSGSAHERTTADVWRVVGRHRMAIVAIVFIVGGTQVLNYAWNSGLPNTAAAIFGQNAGVIFGMTTVLNLLILFLSPVAGRIADAFGIRRVFIWTRLASIPLVFTVVLYAEPSVAAFALVMIVGGVVLPFALGFFNAVIASLLPTVGRVTGVGLAYSIGVAVFGGTASYVFVGISSLGLYWGFPIYVGGILLTGVALYLAAIKRTGLYVDSEDPRRVAETEPTPAHTANDQSSDG